MPVASPRDASIAVMLASFIALPLGLIATSPPATATPAIAADRPVAHVGPVATVSTPVHPSASAQSCVPAPLETRAAAVLMVGLPGVTTADDPLARDVTSLGVSGIFLAASNARTADQVRTLVNGLRAESPGPLVVTTDAESGRVNPLRSLVGGGLSPRRLARQETPDEVQLEAAKLGARLKSLGVDLDLAPVLDLDDGPYDGVIGDRSFGTDPDIAAVYGAAFRTGLSSVGVGAAIKHFPGEGGSHGDTHLHPATVDTPLAELVGHDLVPFQREIAAGAQVVMVNHLDVTALRPDTPASLAPETYQLLRSMGFTGVAVTDSLGMGAVNSRYDFPAAAVRAIEAGADLAFATDGRQARRMRDALVAAVNRGELPAARLDEAATRVGRLTGADVSALTCAES